MKDLLSKLDKNILGIKTARMLTLVTWLVACILTMFGPVFMSLGALGWVLHLVVILAAYWVLRNAAQEIDARLKSSKEEEDGE